MSGTELEVPQTMQIDSAPPEEKPGERPLSVRERMMADIYDRAEERRQQEMDEGHQREEAQAAEEAGETPQASEAPAADHAATPPGGPQVSTAQPGLRAVTLPNGQRVTVTDEQHDQLASMGMLANLALHTPPPQAVQPQPQFEQPAPRPHFVVNEDKIEQAVQKIQFGGPDEGKAGLRDLIQDVLSNVQIRQAPQVDANQIIAVAMQRTMAEQQLRRDTEQIQQEYSEIFKSPQLMALAHMNAQALRERDAAVGQRRSELDIYREAGNAVYDALRLPRPGINSTASQAAGNGRDAVLERKRAAPSNPRSVDRRAVEPAMMGGPSGSQIVDAIRRSRGQHPLN